MITDAWMSYCVTCMKQKHGITQKLNVEWSMVVWHISRHWRHEEWKICQCECVHSSKHSDSKMLWQSNLVVVSPLGLWALMILEISSLLDTCLAVFPLYWDEKWTSGVVHLLDTLLFVLLTIGHTTWEYVTCTTLASLAMNFLFTFMLGRTKITVLMITNLVNYVGNIAQ